MKKINIKKLILSLIKDDLINSKLVYGLNAMGLNSENYFLHLSDTIFDLLDFEDSKETEQVFKRYIELTKHVVFIDITKSQKPLNDLVLKIYCELVARKVN